ncbi:MAG: PIG-L family deacetylase, partial [Pseudomonas sp.]
MSRKQQLLKRHRRNKRIALLIGLLVLIAAGVLVAWWLPLVLAVVLWAAHEAWFADHLFYSPKDDYEYAFPTGSEQPGLRLEAGRLVLDSPLGVDETLIVGIELKRSWLGRFVDPTVEILGLDSPDRQVFERGVAGRRYLNLTGAAEALTAGKVELRGRWCRIKGQPT